MKLSLTLPDSSVIFQNLGITLEQWNVSADFSFDLFSTHVQFASENLHFLKQSVVPFPTTSLLFYNPTSFQRQETNASLFSQAQLLREAFYLSMSPPKPMPLGLANPLNGHIKVFLAKAVPSRKE